MTNHSSHESMDTALVELLSVLEPEYSPIPEYPEVEPFLFEACRLITRELGITIKKNDDFKARNSIELLESIAENSNFRIRGETLSPFWWQYDCGPLLVFRISDGRPMAMLRRQDAYVWIDENAGIEEPLTPELNKEIAKTAYRFYQCLPAGKLHTRDFLKFMSKDISVDFRQVILLQLYAALLALLFPIFTGVIFNNLIPNADLKHLNQVIVLLVVTGIAALLFGIAQGLRLLRIRLKATLGLQAAIWDRTLRLPLSFFRNFTAGDLSTRISGMDTIQRTMSDTFITTILTGTFSIFSLLLMFYYDVLLALAACVFVLVAIALSVVFNILQLHYQRVIINLEGKISGLLYQFLIGIRKIRVANAISKAFAVWSHNFSEKSKISFKARMNVAWFEAIFPLVIALATITIYYLAVHHVKYLSFGYFIAFYAAFVQFFGATLEMSTAVVKTLSIIPLFERIKPIFQNIPEDSEKTKYRQFTQDIKLQEVTLEYKTGVPVVENFSLTIPKGAFIGLAGYTGSGKSSILKLILGLEKLHSGHILFDGHDIATIDMTLVRRFCGAVLQNSTLITGTIYENITALNPILTLEDAWKAAELMQIAKDIRSMPMGMHTFIAEGGSNISAGQKQRLMMARAIVHSPQILLLDEATSALDNATQQKVAEAFDAMAITRIVVAHRLSLLQNADVIYVLNKGIIVEQGKFEELKNSNGLFAEMLKKQTV